MRKVLSQIKIKALECEVVVTMEVENIEQEVTFSNLKWDSDYFGVTSAKVILHRPLALHEWDALKMKFNDYEFISIVNQNSEPINAQYIGKDTTAFIADVNIQFVKELKSTDEPPNNITIHKGLDRNEQVIQIVDFPFSKFTEDPELAKRGGKKVYHQWIINSFGKENKYYALHKDDNGNINGFVLHSYTGDTCLIEYIAVSTNVTKAGIGTSLFKALEQAAYNKGFKKIKVGTQVRNMGAINFYHKLGCKQVGCHQVYHLWNSKK